jgi:hypothetical protein
MLARTPYLTAQELGIREIEHEYLSRFVQEGEQGKLPEHHRFDMGEWLECEEGGACGTVGCIAGTMELYARQDGRFESLAGNPLRSHYGAIYASAPLRSLFLGSELDFSIPDATLSQAVACTKNFLQTGKVEWEKFIGEQA